jgi:hypothetical protein
MTKQPKTNAAKPKKAADLPPIPIPIEITVEELEAIDSLMGKLARATDQLPPEYSKLRKALQMTTHILVLIYQQCDKMKPIR